MQPAHWHHANDMHTLDPSNRSPNLLTLAAPGRWLQLLQLLLEPIGIPSNITINGTLNRRPNHERIQHLAAVRNALLPPVHFSPAASDPGAQVG